MKKYPITALSIVFLLTLWQVLSIVVGQPKLIPTVQGLVMTLIELFGSSQFYLSVGTTILRGISGMTISLVAAALFAYLFAKHALLYDFFRPVLAIMRSVPVISFILLMLIFLDTESIPLVIGFLTMFPLLTENLTKGIKILSPELKKMSKLFCISRYNRWAAVTYPQLKPFLYSGLTSAVGFGWRAIIMGEVLAQTSLGIGGEMKRAQSFIAVPELIAWTIVAVLISYLSDKVIEWLSKRKFRTFYRPERDEADSPSLPITLSNVWHDYGIADFSFHFEAGKIYGISAPSGAGKTTLLNLINGTLRPTEGHIDIDRRYGIASVFHETALLPDLLVLENVAIVMARTYKKIDALYMAAAYLHLLDMGDFFFSRVDELSAGQQQRVAIARAMALSSPFLLMDEPFRGLDDKTKKLTIGTIKEILEKIPQTVIFTSHSQEELNLLADEVISL